MNVFKRDRLAAPVMVVYWLLLVGGLALYTSIRSADPWSVTPIWIGAVIGTAIGQAIALRDFRFWVVFAMTFVLLIWGMPHVPHGLASKQLWMAFIPAILCGFWSLGDRASLIAFWFPTVIWMLSILDRTDADSPPDPSGVLLLGGLAIVFIVFLRVRESRRVGLWSTVSSAPLATLKPSIVLKSPPGRHLARAGWTLLVSAITFSVTAWMAPYLWHVESFEGDHNHVPGEQAMHGLPCCTLSWDEGTTRSRVKEYFDLGRGHDNASSPPREGIDCRACDAVGAYEPGGIVAGGFRPTEIVGEYPAIDLPPGNGWSGSQPGTGAVAPPTAAGIPPAVPARPYEDFSGSTPESSPPPGYAPPRPDWPQPPSQQAPSQPIEQPPPVPTPTKAIEQQPMTPPPPPAPPTVIASAPKSVPVSSVRPHPPAPATIGPSLVRWIALIVAAAILFQLVNLALRPLRRLITLRHLRRPFWNETVDQRVSNSWQLALVGLRDAGWHSSTNEPPREFAQRVGIDGLERCATILERARHGIGIDSDDLTDMRKSADSAYRSARSRVGRVARAVSWVRWPLT